MATQSVPHISVDINQDPVPAGQKSNNTYTFTINKKVAYALGYVVLVVLATIGVASVSQDVPADPTGCCTAPMPPCSTDKAPTAAQQECMKEWAADQTAAATAPGALAATQVSFLHTHTEINLRHFYVPTRCGLRHAPTLDELPSTIVDTVDLHRAQDSGIDLNHSN
jgi:hypothetical protein